MYGEIIRLYQGCDSLQEKPESGSAAVLAKAEHDPSLQVFSVSLLLHYVALPVLHKSTVQSRLLLEFVHTFSKQWLVAAG